MENLQALDLALFRVVNSGLKNPFFDWVLPWFSANVLFLPALLVLAIGLVRWGGTRGRLLLFFLLLTFVLGDPVIVNSLKKLISRPRPFAAVPDLHLMVGRGSSGSMPSAHAANWCAGALVAAVFYRRSLAFMLPLAMLVCLSRVYVGAHYPSDVLGGALLGTSYAALVLWGSQALWQSLGRRWFPLWWNELPSLINPAQPAKPGEVGSAPATPPPETTESTADLDTHWLRLSYVLIGVLLFGHLAYLAAGEIELSEDEAYQWLWSKRLALSYFSKPPLIAYTQWLGTFLWGDTAFGVRFFSPVLGAVGSLLVVRFLARQVGGWAACLSVLAASAMPLLMVGSTLLTIDALSVLFWTAAVVCGWTAVQKDSTGAWMWVGVWMGLGFLSKYIALFQWLCWGVFFLLWPPARGQLRRPGPYLALGISLLGVAPVVAWNAQNQWITVTHLADRGGLSRSWEPTLRFSWDFLGAEMLLLNPIFFLGMLWAAVAFWRSPVRSGWTVYLFAMGAPLFLFYLGYTVRARVQPNWIAPAVLPLVCLALAFWTDRWRRGQTGVRHGLWAGLILGWLVVVPLHDTRLIAKATGRPLPVALDPLRRVLGWTDVAQAVAEARTELLAEGRPVFIIGHHYGLTSLLTFYLPEAKRGVPHDPLVFCLASEQPKNQFWFWPGYEQRQGQNALYVAEVRSAKDPPPMLLRQFASVTDLGIREVRTRGRLYHRLQLFACRDLR